MRSDVEIRMLTEKSRTLCLEKVPGFQIKDAVQEEIFRKCVKVLFLRYRYKLYNVDPERLIGFNPILPSENAMLFKHNMEAYRQLNKMIFQTGKNYNHYRDEIDIDSCFDLTKTFSLLGDMKSNLKKYKHQMVSVM